jgi:hypothetical protein
LINGRKFKLEKKWKEADFWNWFIKNQDPLYALTPNSENLEGLLTSLDDALSKFSPELEFELNLEADEKGLKTFYISGAGVMASFPHVESLAALAPESDKWKFVKYKQRKEEIGEIQVGEGMTFSLDNIFYSLEEDEPGKVGINLYFDNFRQNIEDLFGQVGFIYLDAILGEYDVATKVGQIQFLSKPAGNNERIKNANNLRSEFDTHFKNSQVSTQLP